MNSLSINYDYFKRVTISHIKHNDLVKRKGKAKIKNRKRKSDIEEEIRNVNQDYLSLFDINLMDDDEIVLVNCHVLKDIYSAISMKKKITEEEFDRYILIESYLKSIDGFFIKMSVKDIKVIFDGEDVMLKTFRKNNEVKKISL